MMASKNCFHQRMMQIISVVTVMFVHLGFFAIIPILACYILFASKYWWICVLYFAWFIFDKDADFTGRRSSERMRSFSWWIHVINYFPLKIVKLPWGELDKARNYLFCFFPHGVLAVGACITMNTNHSKFQEFFPHHKPYLHIMKLFFMIPILRELELFSGNLQASEEALDYILGKEDGGNISGLVVGGSQETYFSNPGVHKIYYKKRKGFIKKALINGAPLVPVYVFGENEVFAQSELERDSFLFKLIEMLRKKLGFTFICPQNRIGMFPRRTPLTVVVGEPLDVKKNANPTQEDIDHLHQLFQKRLVELFESQKKYYLKDHETAMLEIC